MEPLQGGGDDIKVGGEHAQQEQAKPDREGRDQHAALAGIQPRQDEFQNEIKQDREGNDDARKGRELH